MRDSNGTRDGRCVTTVDGYVLDYDAPIWLVPTPTGLNSIAVHDLPGADDDLRRNARELFAMRLGEVSPGRVMGELSAFRRLLSVALASGGEALNSIGWKHFTTFSERFREATPHSVFEAGQVLKCWARLNVQGLDADLLARLPTLDDSYAPRESPVRIRCPERGALTKSELADVVAKLHAAAASGTVTPGNYVLCLIFLTFALRPGQAALLKARDIIEAERGETSCLRIARLKQRGARPGTVHRIRPLVDRLGRLLAAQAGRARAEARKRGVDPDAAPLFPRQRSGRYDHDGVRPELPGYEGHSTSSDLANRFARTMDALGAVSERTGKSQRITPIRGRRTMGTLRTAAGDGADKVGDLLDHGSTKNLSSYCEPSRAVMSRIEVAADRDLRAIARAFESSGRKPKKRGL